MSHQKKHILKSLASLKLAVLVLSLIAIISAVGTIVEAKYDAEVAGVWVYRSVWMYLVLGLLSVNLMAVMIDRWPWKQRHTGFVLAHIGILILLLGGIITQQYGIDGTMYFQIGTSSRSVTISDKALSVYSTFDGSHFTSLIHKDVNFLKSPVKESPLVVPIDDGALEIVDSLQYAQVSEKVIPSEGELDGAAVRFQLYNGRVNQLQWIVQSRTGKMTVSEFGPLKMALGQEELKDVSETSELVGANVLYLSIEPETTKASDASKTSKASRIATTSKISETSPITKTSTPSTSSTSSEASEASQASISSTSSESTQSSTSSTTIVPPRGAPTSFRIRYSVFKKESAKSVLNGVLGEGDEVTLPWMGFRFKVLRAYPKAHREWEVKAADRPSPTATPAILVRYKDRTQWAQLNDIVRFFTNQGAYLVKYGQKQIDIGEELFLKKFSIGRYQGTRRAMAYESVVTVPSLGDVTISMNEPLKHNGFTFYQASFQEDPRTGEPVASILSVNKDPGRALKYLGSLIMVLGVIHLFWFKRRQQKKQKEELAEGNAI